MTTIRYTPPPTLRAFIKDYRPGELFYDWVVGPVGSGKTTAIFMKLMHMAKLQKPGPDGIRRTRAVVVRNTAPMLRDTTLVSWSYWFQNGVAGRWEETKKIFTLRFGDVECEVLFRPLDTAEDISRVLSLEITFAVVDEFIDIPREVIDALSARCGRYPSAVQGGATNWGMWGSSNPSTEDNWWYDYLHSNPAIKRWMPKFEDDDAQRAYEALRAPETETNGTYFLQPSGFAPNAENLENLPGGRGYYINQAKGKTEAWIKQFLEAEWGFSVSGTPVVPSFRGALHVSKGPIKWNPHLPIVVGLDPGLGGSALIFGQEDLDGRLLVLGELVQAGYSAERLISERMKPYIKARFPGAEIIIAPDPAADNRAQTDAKTVVDVFRKHRYEVIVETNNRLPLRLDAIEHYTTKLIDGTPALQIDGARCPILVRALKGGWRYAKDKRLLVQKAEPEKNEFSHPGDSFGYLARYFHREVERASRRAARPARRHAPVPTYHVR